MIRVVNIVILFVGNKLSKHGANPTTVETLGLTLSKKLNLVSCSDKKNKIFRFIDILLHLIRFRRNLDLVIVDTYSGWSFYYTLLVAIFSKLWNIDYIPILHGGNLDQRISKNKRLCDFIFNNSFFNVSPSHYLRDVFFAHGYEVSTIPNSINISDYKYRVKINETPKILFLRAFEGIYNPVMALEVFERVIKVFPEAKLHMVGPIKDSSYNDFQDKAKELNIHNSISIEGKLKKVEWLKVAESCNCFINTTNFDNMPVSVIEAMALGLPVFSTNPGGIPYLIDDGVDGFLSDVNDPMTMANNIIGYFEGTTPSSYDSMNARIKAETFDVESVLSQWLKLLGNIGNK